MTKHLILKKCVWFFYIIQMIYFYVVMVVEKNNNFLKRKNVIYSYVWLWKKTITLECTYLKTNMVAMNLLKVGLSNNQDKQIASK
jgi:hypothetical protein